MKPIFRVLYSKELKCYGVRMRTKYRYDFKYIFQCGDIWTVNHGIIDSIVSIHMLDNIKYNPFNLAPKGELTKEELATI